MDDEGWEARMAARAKERWQPPDDHADMTIVVMGYGSVSDWDAHRRWAREAWRKRIEEYRATMTLGEAKEALDRAGEIICACIGPPGCCRALYGVAEEIVYVASVAAHFMSARIGQRLEDDLTRPID